MFHSCIRAEQILLVVTYHNGARPPYGSGCWRPFMAYTIRFGRLVRFLPAVTRANSKLIHTIS